MIYTGLPILRSMRALPELRPDGGYELYQPLHSLLLLETKGARLYIAGQSYELKGAAVVLLPPHTLFELQVPNRDGGQAVDSMQVSAQYTAPGSQGLRFCAAMFEWLDRGEGAAEHGAPALVELADTSLLGEAAELYHRFEGKLYNSVSQRLSIQSRFLQLLANAWWLLEQPTAISFASRRHGIDNVLWHVHRFYNRRMDRDVAVELSEMSLRRFTARFKQQTGRTFIEYLNRWRIEKAQELMLTKRLTLHEVAQQVGYADEFYLSRKFKQVTGMSPTAYISKPKRIASLDHAYTIDLLALNVMPCSAITDQWMQEYFQIEARCPAFRPLYWQMELEERLDVLKEARPDILLLPERSADDDDLLHAIRKLGLVVQMPWKGIGWRRRFWSIAELTGNEQSGREWLDRFDARIEEAKERLRHRLCPGETVAIINIRSDRNLVYIQGYMGADLLYDLLQLTPPRTVALQRHQGLEHPELSYTSFADAHWERYDADHYFVAVENSVAARKRWAQLQEQPLWRERSAVKHGHVYVVEMSKWYGYASAVLHAQLDDVLASLLGSGQ